MLLRRFTGVSFGWTEGLFIFGDYCNFSSLTSGSLPPDSFLIPIIPINNHKTEAIKPIIAFIDGVGNFQLRSSLPQQHPFLVGLTLGSIVGATLC